MSLSVRQVNHRLMSDALRDVLLTAVGSAPDADGGVGSIQCRACAVLYLLLHDHQVDQRGHCRSCRRPGAIFGQRRRRCRIHLAAKHWLRHPDTFLLTQLTHELGLGHDHGWTGERPTTPGPAVHHLLTGRATWRSSSDRAPDGG